MARKPNLSALDSYFKKGKDFRLTDAEYAKETGAWLPRDKYYIKRKSALARKAEEEGYEVDVIEKEVILRKK